jgi:hypothetical protein
MKFAFIHRMAAEKAWFTIARMCRLFEVTRQGYYAYVRSLCSPRLAEEVALLQRIKTIHAENKRAYGSPASWALRDVVTRRRLARILRIRSPRTRSIVTSPLPALINVG